MRARLMGIDAPESDQLCKDSKGKQYECGKEAAAALRGRYASGSRQISRGKAWGGQGCHGVIFEFSEDPFRMNCRIGSSEVRCKATDVDRYGRTVAQCFVGGSDLGDFMVKNGEAVAYTQYSKEYASQENEAKSKCVVKMLHLALTRQARDGDTH